MKKMLSLLACIVMLFTLVSCGPKVESLELEAPAEMNVGEELALEVVILPQEAAGRKLEYSSSDESVVAVDENGVLTAVGAGSADITIKAHDDVTLVHSVTVIIPVEDVTAIDKLELPVGATESAKAVVQPANATLQTLKYSCSDTAVATVDENGVVTAVSIGEALITATAHNGASAQTWVSVLTSVTEITINKEKITLRPGATETLVAALNPEDAVFGANITWFTSDASVAKVDQAGVVTAVAEGQADIIVKTDTGLYAICEVTVARAGGSSGSSGSSGSAGGSSGTGSAGGTGGTGGSSGGSSSVTDADIQSIVAQARSYAASYGFSATGGLLASWRPPTSIAGSYSFMLSSVYEAIDAIAAYFDMYAAREDWAGTPLAVEYLPNGPGGAGIYVSY